jgi:hypothetical protein
MKYSIPSRAKVSLPVCRVFSSAWRAALCVAGGAIRNTPGQKKQGDSTAQMKLSVQFKNGHAISLS